MLGIEARDHFGGFVGDFHALNHASALSTRNEDGRELPPAPAIGCSEETERLGRIADQQVLGLLVMVEHHLARLAPNARGLVAAEGGVSGIGVEAIRPYASGLDGAPEAIGPVAISGPYARAKTVERVIGDGERIFLALEFCNRDDRP